jgi:hypothetical protein
VERKPQQQTLSIRVSDKLREFLERSRQVLSSGRGESVSTSDVAKILLESAKEDRLDFRLEVAELQEHPTESLVAIRRKWEAREPLARAEWVFLGQYIQVAAEDRSEIAAAPSAQAFIGLLGAFLAVRGLRIERGAGLDRYYLGNLGVPEGTGFNERQLDPELVPQTVARLIQQLREAPEGPKPLLAGRCFYVALRDESLTDVAAITGVLEPHILTLFRLGARGHWFRERRPVRSRDEHPGIVVSVPTLEQEGFRLSSEVNGHGEVSLSFSMAQKNVMYPISSYPEIREFASMLERMKPGAAWNGVYFHAHTSGDPTDSAAPLLFRRRSDGITLGFSIEEWECLKRLMTSALLLPKLQPFWRELELIYGEL